MRPEVQIGGNEWIECFHRKISEGNISYLKLCRLGSGGLSRRFGRGLAWLRLEMERIDEGRERKENG